jgi:hypothetical protein
MSASSTAASAGEARDAPPNQLTRTARSYPAAWTDATPACYAERVKGGDLAVLEDLEGERCWSAAAGLERDWLVVIDLGARQRRSLRLANPRLSFEQRTFEGSAGVVVEAAWRIDGPDRVLASCLDARAPADRVRAGLAELEGRVVTGARAPPPGRDLALELEGGLVFRVFVLEPWPPPPISVPEGERPPPPPPPPRRAWMAWSPRGALVVGPHGRLGDPRGGLADPPPRGPSLALVDDD